MDAQVQEALRAYRMTKTPETQAALLNACERAGLCAEWRYDEDGERLPCMTTVDPEVSMSSCQGCLEDYAIDAAEARSEADAERAMERYYEDRAERAYGMHHGWEG